jgi:hypothetical protein
MVLLRALFVLHVPATKRSLFNEIGRFPSGKLVPTRSPDFGFNPEK